VCEWNEHVSVQLFASLRVHHCLHEIVSLARCLAEGASVAEAPSQQGHVALSPECRGGTDKFGVAGVRVRACQLGRALQTD
jgi:hypothetical protein